MRERKQYGSWTQDTPSGIRMTVESFIVHDHDGSPTGETEHVCSLLDLEDNSLVYPPFVTFSLDVAIQTVKSLSEILGENRTRDRVEKWLAESFESARVKGMVN